MELVCIVCPNGCRMTAEKVDGQIVVSGARCKRGEAFFKTELTCPVRTVTSSVKTTVDGYPVLSVRTDGEIPKEKIQDLIRLLGETVVKKPLTIGSVLIPNVFGTGVNVITTTDMEETL